MLALPEGKAALGAALGLGELAVAAVCDLGFAAAVAEKLAAADPAYGPASQALKARQDKALRRRADTARQGKKSARRKP